MTKHISGIHTATVFAGPGENGTPAFEFNIPGVAACPCKLTAVYFKYLPTHAVHLYFKFWCRYAIQTNNLSRPFNSDGLNAMQVEGADRKMFETANPVETIFIFNQQKTVGYSRADFR